MRFEITLYDDHGTPHPPVTADTAQLREHLARAALTGRRLHIRPRPRPAPAHTPRSTDELGQQ
ncbi:DUF2863 family protein [Kitasatospora sp. NBC_00085]|uniref:hypothetical protein n=1 Tax=Streptomycetaceae TaxID=2062 RepID=UPI0006AF8BC1|nr:hypothetical protein [Streptomyces sp. XY431]KOV39015.1 hypothetical protein ADK60_01330 [Streptomyces sp. XY431]